MFEAQKSKVEIQRLSVLAQIKIRAHFIHTIFMAKFQHYCIPVFFPGLFSMFSRLRVFLVDFLGSVQTLCKLNNLVQKENKNQSSKIFTGSSPINSLIIICWPPNSEKFFTTAKRFRFQDRVISKILLTTNAIDF